MAKFRKMDDLYGRFLDYDDMTDVPVAMLDENGNTVVMTQAEYEQMLREQEAESKESAADGLPEKQAFKEGAPERGK